MQCSCTRYPCTILSPVDIVTWSLSAFKHCTIDENLLRTRVPFNNKRESALACVAALSVWTSGRPWKTSFVSMFYRMLFRCCFIFSGATDVSVYFVFAETNDVLNAVTICTQICLNDCQVLFNVHFNECYGIVKRW